jgi:hypothetical protein
MASRKRATWLLALLFGGAAACGKFLELPTAPIDPDPPNPAATLSAVQGTIFTPTCAVVGCHHSLGAASSAELELTAGNAYGNLVGRPSTQIPTLLRVAPGAPADSYLIRKITGTQPFTGERMPMNAPPLTEEQIQLIRDWIRRGAPND